MVKLDTFVIQLEHPNGVVFAGQRLHGFVSLSLNEPLKCRNLCLYLHGRANTRWTETNHGTSSSRGRNNRRRRVTRRGDETYVQDKIVVFGMAFGEDSTTIPEGQHQFPFEFVLPPNCPSSFQGTYGWIRYYMKAVIDRPWRFDYDVEVCFTVIGQHDLNLDAYAMRPIAETREKSLGFFGSSGKLMCTARMPCCGLVSGQRLNLSVVVESTSDRGIKGVNVYLKQQTEFVARGNHYRTTDNTILTSASAVFIPGNTPTTLDFTSIVIPPVPPLLINCHIINITYYIHIEVDPVGMHTDLDMKFPIKIGTIPLQSTFGQMRPAMPRPPGPMMPGQPGPMIPGQPGPMIQGQKGPMIPGQPGQGIPGGYPTAPYPPQANPFTHAPGQRMVGQNSGTPAYESVYPDLPPPSYESCVVGQPNVKKGVDVEEEEEEGERNQSDEDDDEEEKKKGGLSDPSFLPKYPTYSFQS